MQIGSVNNLLGHLQYLQEVFTWHRGDVRTRASSLRFPLMALHLFTWYHHKTSCRRESPRVGSPRLLYWEENREFKIRRLRTTTVKHATAHDQNHVTVHFSRVVLQLRWVVELFRVVESTENILLVFFCRLGNSRISSFRKKVFNSPALSERKAKYVSCV